MGSTVTFKPDTGEAKTVTLVFPGDADISEGKVSILTPIGTALIGLSPGQSILWTTRDGRRHELSVLAVSQPALERDEAARAGRRFRQFRREHKPWAPPSAASFSHAGNLIAGV